jgi:inhibitor of cysteine peptidase
MKIKALFSILIAILALSLPGCVQRDRVLEKQLTYDDFTKNKNQATSTQIVNVGNTIKITLPSNPSTGFRWELADVSDNTVLKWDGESQYILPENNGAVGASGQEIWTFQAMKRGTSTISLAYSRPWEGGTKNEWTLNMPVHVE